MVALLDGLLYNAIVAYGPEAIIQNLIKDWGRWPFVAGVVVIGYVILLPTTSWFLAPLVESELISNLLRGPRALRNSAVAGYNAALRRLSGRTEVLQYSAPQRSLEDFRELLERYISRSRIVYFRVLSGHTMFYDPAEKFIIETLDRLPAAVRERKDCRVQLLDPNDPTWEPRGRWYVERILRRAPAGQRVTTYEHYVQRCRDIEKELRDRGFAVSYYPGPANWRLQIFDNAVFVSRYGDREEGHLTPCAVIRLGPDSQDATSLYDGFRFEFERLPCVQPPALDDKSR